jgi:hypothetical protein
VVGGTLHVGDVGAERAHPVLHVAALAPKALVEVEVLMPVAARLRELHVHDVAVGGRAIERVARRVRATVLHGLEHGRHVTAHLTLATAVAVDDAGDAAHA